VFAVELFTFVMAGLDPAIHVFVPGDDEPLHSREAICLRVIAESSRPSLQRAQGMPGASTRPQPYVRIKKARKLSHRRLAENVPAFPARMVLTVSFVVSLVIGLSCHHRQRIIPPT